MFVAGVYLFFLLVWGLNYRRLPLEGKLEFDESRVTRAAATGVALEAVRLVNDTYGAAHAPDGGPAALARLSPRRSDFSARARRRHRACASDRSSASISAGPPSTA